MARKTRLGNFSKINPTQPQGPQEVGLTSLTVVSQQGRGRSIEREFPFDRFVRTPLIMNSLPALRREVLRRKTPNSLKQLKGFLRDFADYVSYYEGLAERKVITVADVDISFCHAAVDYFELKPGRVARLRGTRALLTALGVDKKLLPIVPWEDSPTAPRKLLEPDVVKKATGMAKNDVRVIFRRLKEADTLSKIGHDPRRENGGRLRDWQKPECRYWIMENVFKFEARRFDQLRFELGYNSELRGLEKKPGAEYVDIDGCLKRHEGWLGHQRWRFPFAGDLAPFLVLLLLRASVNAAALSTIRTNKKWYVPCPIKLGANRHEDFVYILCDKVRGRRKPNKRPKVVRFISEATHWDHPFRLLKFIEAWTLPLRKEIIRRIAELNSLPSLTLQQSDELATLIEVKNDLFIFKTEQQISSFARDINSGKIGRALTATLKRYGLPTNIRYLRDVGLAHTQRSGTSLLILRIIAQHSNLSTSRLYARREQLIARQEKMTTACFDSSVELIRAKKFSKKNLRESLTRQGFNQVQVENLVSADNVTRFGNGCADPLNPPKHFAFGTEKGQPCRLQDCIDGCPNARWFRQSLPFLIEELGKLEHELAQAALESYLTSTLEVRIKRLKTLIARWPKDAYDKALNTLARKAAA
ncbi:hypothetical protein [Neorhizobium tomejilense]|uniref:hypothetical protein n=1 Tax=Neorhizobium tomejilense TaxID=2093828 RepID=UPI000CF85876|nr:hypothetical protein [Neorhizobium tomejilense]